MIEVIILWILALIWIIFATFQDIKTTEIYNWLNFSLIIFAIAFRFFYSFFNLGDFNFLYQGIIWFAIFFIIGELFYYARMFAGGDAKLFESLGAVIPINASFFVNVKIALIFILLFLIVGFFYGLTATTIIFMKNKFRFVKQFKKEFKKIKVFAYFMVILAIALVILSYTGYPFWIFGILSFIFPLLYLFAKSVDESCMIKKISADKLMEGDWLYKDVKMGNKFIKASWDGLSKKDIEILRKKKKEVFIRIGVQFAPVFLISFLILFLSFIFHWFGI